MCHGTTLISPDNRTKSIIYNVFGCKVIHFRYESIERVSVAYDWHFVIGNLKVSSTPLSNLCFFATRLM